MTIGGLDVAEILRVHGLDSVLGDVGAYIARQRWSGGRDSAVRDIAVDDAAVIAEGTPTLIFTVIRVAYADSREIRYALPLGLRPVGDALAERAPDYMIGTVALGSSDCLLYDALGDPAYALWLWDSIRERREVGTARARLRFECPEPGVLDPTEHPAVRPMSVEQSNTSLQLGDATFLKHMRRLGRGPAHELEMASALARSEFEHFARVLGAGLYVADGTPPVPFALLQPFLHNASEGWALAVTSLRDLYAEAEESGIRDPKRRHVIVEDQGGAFVSEAGRLAGVVAEMHLALARPGLGAAFEPVAVTAAQLGAWADEMTSDLDELLSQDAPELGPLRAARDPIVGRFVALRGIQPSGLCIQIHGDLHLGQVLRTDAGWIILDFEGEPDRGPEQRHALSSPLRDVAGMLRSFDYAAAVALVERFPDPEDAARLTAYGDTWARANRDAFWAAYLQSVFPAPLLPAPGAAMTVRRAFEVHKAVYEAGYELRHRPGWVGIPIRFLLEGAE